MRKIKFYNRERELQALEKEYSRDGASFTVIYGRRRVGKTTLIKHFIEGKRAIYFLADKQSEGVQINRFKEITAEALNDDILKNIRIENWDDLFLYIAKNVKPEEKFIIVIDEFQYLVKVNKAVPSIFQRIWDEMLLPRSFMLILSGSLIGMMYQHTLSYDSPLYGRRTSQLKLNPLRFRDFSLFFPHQSFRQLIELYAVLSGVPKYIEVFRQSGDIFRDIEDNILAKDSFLYQEPIFILNEELSDTTTYFSIMAVISAGEHKIGNIAKKLQVSTNNLTSFFNKLMELELVEREVPVTEQNPQKSKRGLYFIKDHFFRFWFRYIFPYRSYIEIENSRFVLRKIKESFNEYVSLSFERVMAQYLMEMETPPFEIERVGRWWNNAEEIDIVAIGDQDILFGECKWRNQPISPNVLHDLKRKSALIDPAGRRPHYALFSRSGFTPPLLTQANTDPSLHLFDISTPQLP